MSAASLRAAPTLTVDSLSASGRSSERFSLPSLQSKMKCDPEGYETELTLIYEQFKSSFELFQQQAALSVASISGVGSDSTIAKELSDRAMFLAHVTPSYPQQLSNFPNQLAELLRSTARSLPSSVRFHIAQALILLSNRKMVDIGQNLALFMELQVLGDRALRKLSFSHVLHAIRRMNQKHKNESKNRQLQDILFAMLQEDNEAKAKRSLILLCDLHRRKVWFDDKTANAICAACFHSSSRIMIAALSFLLDYEKIENDDDSDASSSEDDSTSPHHQVVLSKEAVYKANKKGTTSTKKKKKAKLQRVIRSMKKQQRMGLKNSGSNHHSPLNCLKDAQGFAERLFSRLQTCNERFEVKMMMMKVVARTVGLHRLILLNFYPYLQKYVQPHQRDVVNLLAAAVQACHDMVPPDAVEPLFRQIVNQFVHDRSRPEAIVVGLNVVRELCMRMPLLMTEDLLQDLVLYKKSHEKSVSSAARSLVTLFRELYPLLLSKKDRGRPTDPKARPKAFGEVTVASDVPGIELLLHDDEDDDEDNSDAVDDEFQSSSEEDHEDREDGGVATGEDDGTDIDGSSDEALETNYSDGDHPRNEQNCGDERSEDESEDDSDRHESSEDDEREYEESSHGILIIEEKNEPDSDVIAHSKGRKRKLADLNAADRSLRALKKLAGAKMKPDPLEAPDGILSTENFQQIKVLMAKKEAKRALTRHGLFKRASDAKSGTIKIPTSDELSFKRVDAAKLEVNVRKKMSKEERLLLIRAGREETGKYRARAAIKQKKTGGLSNRQKEHKKAMPLAAKRAKVAKSRQEKKRKERRSGKQFRGRKAWK